MDSKTRETRYDLFLSFHGSEKLRPTFTTHQLAEATKSVLEDHAAATGHEPSIFLDSDSLHQEVSDIFPAILQTRGRGLALFLLTKKYLRRKWCLTELRSFLYLHEQAHNQQLQSADVKLRFIVLGDNAGDILEDPHIDRLCKQLPKFTLRTNVRVTTLEETSTELSRKVREAWVEDGIPTIWGRTRDISFLELQSFFTRDDLDKFRAVLKINETTIANAFSEAELRSLVTDQDVSNLYRVVRRCCPATKERKKNAVESFELKWGEGTKWTWDQLLADLQNIYEEAARVVGAVKDEESANAEGEVSGGKTEGSGAVAVTNHGP